MRFIVSAQFREQKPPSATRQHRCNDAKVRGCTIRPLRGKHLLILSLTAFKQAICLSALVPDRAMGPLRDDAPMNGRFLALSAAANKAKRLLSRSHGNEQTVWMLRGKVEFRLGSEQRVCGQGDVIVIPRGTEHEARLREDTEVIDFFAPPRDDFLLGGKPAYISEGRQTGRSSQSGAVTNTS